MSLSPRSPFSGSPTFKTTPNQCIGEVFGGVVFVILCAPSWPFVIQHLGPLAERICGPLRRAGCAERICGPLRSSPSQTEASSCILSQVRDSCVVR